MHTQASADAQKHWRNTHKEHIKAYRKQYYQAHADKERAYSRRYYAMLQECRKQQQQQQQNTDKGVTL